MWISMVMAALCALVAAATEPHRHQAVEGQRQRPEAIKQMGTRQIGKSGGSSSLLAPGEQKQYKLPSYFDYDLYRHFHGKANGSNGTSVSARKEGNKLLKLRKRLYLRTALKVFEQRAHFRAGRQDQLWSVNELSDLTGAELEALKRSTFPKNTSEPLLKASEISLNQTSWTNCCSHDQVYRHIIGLLEAASSGPQPDWQLSKALVEELEQKPLVPPTSFTSENTGQMEAPEGGQWRRQDHSGETNEQRAALRRAVESSVRQQVAEALSSPQSSLGRQLQRHFSAYFGQPVQLKAKVATEAGGAVKTRRK